MSNVFYATAIGSKSESISGYHPDRVSVSSRHRRAVSEPVARMDPSIVTAYEVVNHSMRIAMLKRTEHDLLAISLSIFVVVCKAINIRNAVSYRAISHGVDTNRN